MHLSYSIAHQQISEYRVLASQGLTMGRGGGLNGLSTVLHTRHIPSRSRLTDTGPSSALVVERVRMVAIGSGGIASLSLSHLRYMRVRTCARRILDT